MNMISTNRIEKFVYFICMMYDIYVFISNKKYDKHSHCTKFSNSACIRRALTSRHPMHQ